ncbi:hypothetical protein KUTG_09937 [Kutzneria sp. 744]|nr:hypothetical protein KUTG_09937 [Kutzneria sp. 744]
MRGRPHAHTHFASTASTITTNTTTTPMPLGEGEQYVELLSREVIEDEAAPPDRCSPRWSPSGTAGTVGSSRSPRGESSEPR